MHVVSAASVPTHPRFKMNQPTCQSTGLKQQRIDSVFRQAPRRAQCFSISSISMRKQLYTQSTPRTDLISPDLKHISQPKSLGTFEITYNKSEKINFKGGIDTTPKEV